MNKKSMCLTGGNPARALRQFVKSSRLFPHSFIVPNTSRIHNEIIDPLFDDCGESGAQVPWIAR